MTGSAGSVGEAAAARLAADPARPLITWYDDATGDRAELSGATLANWVAKTANLLVDGCGLGPGDRAAVLLPPHWQTAVVLLGCWSAGLEVVDGPPESVDVLFAGPESLVQAEQWPAADRYALALAPLAAPFRTVPPGFADYVVEVRVFGDYFSARPTSSPLSANALDRAAQLGIGGGDRVLIDAGAHHDPVDWLLAPLLSGASTVLCGHLDRDRVADRVAAERVTRVL